MRQNADIFVVLCVYDLSQASKINTVDQATKTAFRLQRLGPVLWFRMSYLKKPLGPHQLRKRMNRSRTRFSIRVTGKKLNRAISSEKFVLSRGLSNWNQRCHFSWLRCCHRFHSQSKKDDFAWVRLIVSLACCFLCWSGAIRRSKSFG